VQAFRHSKCLYLKAKNEEFVAEMHRAGGFKPTVTQNATRGGPRTPVWLWQIE